METMDKRTMNIHLDYQGIVKRFSDNPCKEKYFKNDDLGYWELIQKAVAVAGKMAKHYRNTPKANMLYRQLPKEEKRNRLEISGGGGANEIHKISVFKEHGVHTLPIGSVHINFATQELTVEYDETPKSKVKYNYQGIPYKKFINLIELDELNKLDR